MPIFYGVWGIVELKNEVDIGDGMWYSSFAMKYYVYILFCADGTYYTGWTTNIQKRLATHSKGKGAKYTRGRLPVRLLWFAPFESKSEAMKKEYAIKQLSKDGKRAITRGAVNKISYGSGNKQV